MTNSYDVAPNAYVNFQTDILLLTLARSAIEPAAVIYANSTLLFQFPSPCIIQPSGSVSQVA